VCTAIKKCGDCCELFTENELRLHVERGCPSLVKMPRTLKDTKYSERAGTQILYVTEECDILRLRRVESVDSHNNMTIAVVGGGALPQELRARREGL